MGKHYNNPHCFKEKKSRSKTDKDHFEKKNIKKNHIGKNCSNPWCFKKKNYVTKFSTNSILKKNQQR